MHTQIRNLAEILFFKIIPEIIILYIGLTFFTIINNTNTLSFEDQFTDFRSFHGIPLISNNTG